MKLKKYAVHYASNWILLVKITFIADILVMTMLFIVTSLKSMHMC